ncbi:MAG TPA: hypothetical protein PKN62_00625 [bacterium]|nr:hypothetical protein [bacterium]
MKDSNFSPVLEEMTVWWAVIIVVVCIFISHEEPHEKYVCLLFSLFAAFIGTTHFFMKEGIIDKLKGVKNKPLNYAVLSFIFLLSFLVMFFLFFGYWVCIFFLLLTWDFLIAREEEYGYDVTKVICFAGAWFGVSFHMICRNNLEKIFPNISWLDVLSAPDNSNVITLVLIFSVIFVRGQYTKLTKSKSN